MPGSSLYRAQKLSIARRAASSLETRDDIQVIFLTGSVARGIDSADSDIDLAVFTENASDDFIRTFRIDDTLVEINIYLLSRLPKGPATPLLSLQDLRETGRFSTSILLYSRWKDLAQAQSIWLRALLNPESAAELLALASHYVSPAHLAGMESFPDRAYALQGAAAALAVYALSLRPPRFQKPKWVVRDLFGAGFTDLLGAIRTLFFGAVRNRHDAVRLLDAVRGQMRIGLELAGLPPLTLADSMSDEYFYVYRTFQDAESLQNDGDFEGCAYTCVYALRLLNVLLQSFAERSVSEQEINSWRHGSMSVLLSMTKLKEDDLETARMRLIECGLTLEQEYKSRLLAGQPFEYFEEGNWRSNNRSSAVPSS